MKTITKIALGTVLGLALSATAAWMSLDRETRGLLKTAPTNRDLLFWSEPQRDAAFRALDRIPLLSKWHTAQPDRGAVRVLPPGPPLPATLDIDGFMAAQRSSALLVLQRGQLRLERYGLDFDAQGRWTSFSVAKSFTSTLVGAALKDGHIKSLDDKVSDYIVQMKGSAYDDVSVRQLLTMTSGVKWNEDYTDLNSDVAKAGVTPGEPGMNPIVSYMRKLPREAEPGAKFVYKTGETDLAGILVSNAVGKPLSTYLSEKIWAPYGMEQDAIWVKDAAGHERGGCCMSMTARDYARLGQFMLEGGKVNGQDILPEGWVADATKAHQSFPPGGVETGYGYFWWIIPGGYAAEGIFGQQIFVYPAEKLVIAVNSAWPAASKDELWQAQMAFAQAVRRAAR